MNVIKAARLQKPQTVQADAKASFDTRNMIYPPLVVVQLKSIPDPTGLHHAQGWLDRTVT